MTLEELARLQAAFGAQIGARTPDAAALAPWLGVDARGAGALARYGQALRQHHARSLELVYPVLRALGGASWFLAMAHAYGDAHPSRSADLARFGASLPVFLATWPPAAAHGYFADVARLEWLLHQAHGAPDTVALTLRDVQAAGVGQVDTWRLALHPAAVLYRSPWRAAAIWLAHDAAARHVMPADPVGARWRSCTAMAGRRACARSTRWKPGRWTCWLAGPLWALRWRRRSRRTCWTRLPRHSRRPPCCCAGWPMACWYRCLRAAARADLTMCLQWPAAGAPAGGVERIGVGRRG